MMTNVGTMMMLCGAERRTTRPALESMERARVMRAGTTGGEAARGPHERTSEEATVRAREWRAWCA